MLARNITQSTPSLLARLTSDLPVTARRFIRRMRGESQACLIECDDENFYIVKFSTSPAGPNLLANEMLGSLLCASLGIPVPEAAPVYLSPAFLQENEPFITMRDHEMSLVAPAVGLHFGSRLLRPPSGPLFEYISASSLQTITRQPTFIGISMLDLCTRHCGRRQAVYMPSRSPSGFDPTFIDHGSMFGGPHWSFADRGAVTVFPLSFANLLRNKRACLAWAKLIHATVPDVLQACIPHVPRSWYSGQLSTLVEFVFQGSLRLPDFIEQAADQPEDLCQTHRSPVSLLRSAL